MNLDRWVRLARDPAAPGGTPAPLTPKNEGERREIAAACDAGLLAGHWEGDAFHPVPFSPPRHTTGEFDGGPVEI
jgi:hypothetical protein